MLCCIGIQSWQQAASQIATGHHNSCKSCSMPWDICDLHLLIKLDTSFPYGLQPMSSPLLIIECRLLAVYMSFIITSNILLWRAGLRHLIRPAFVFVVYSEDERALNKIMSTGWHCSAVLGSCGQLSISPTRQQLAGCVCSAGCYVYTSVPGSHP